MNFLSQRLCIVAKLRFVGIALAGDSLAIQQALPVIETYSIRQVLVGETASAASAMKICVNYMTMAQLAMLGEVFTFAEKMQLDNSLVLNIVELFFSGNEAIKEYAGKIAKRNFDTAGFELAAGLKDACIFEKAFNSCDVIPSAILGAKHNLVTAQHIGLGKKDWSALTEISRMMAGL
ncbi:NAD-binding protein [Mangrovibacter sp. MFB070]|uniref:NAD-binding protein n=1 Tax=Mangrovibacter sp. MFB070 TaxID=1224318 RepID=UPI00350FD68A